MTPRESADYKQQWMSTENNNPVRLHSDLADAGKIWCRRSLERQAWTDVYEHTFYFENIIVAQNFAMEFSNWTNR